MGETWISYEQRFREVALWTVPFLVCAFVPAVRRLCLLERRPMLTVLVFTFTLEKCASWLQRCLNVNALTALRLMHFVIVLTGLLLTRTGHMIDEPSSSFSSHWLSRWRFFSQSVTPRLRRRSLFACLLGSAAMLAEHIEVRWNSSGEVPGSFTLI